MNFYLNPLLYLIRRHVGGDDMKKLLLKQTTTETWQALVQESAVKASITLSEELESYLVFLLMRFSKEPTLAMSVLATEYLNAQTSYTGV